MALVWADGFAHWGTLSAMNSSGYTAESIVLRNNAAFARTGSYYMEITGNGFRQYLMRNIEPAPVVTLGAAIRFDQLNGRNDYAFPMVLTNTAFNAGAMIRFYDDGSVVLQRVGRNGDVAGFTVARTGINVYNSAVWNYFELQVNMNTGRAIVRLNNVVILDYTGNFGVGNLSRFSFAFGAANPVPTVDRTGYVSDVYVTVEGPGMNPGFLGDVRCRTLFPVANGDNQQWAVTGAASAVAALDNVPFDPTQYIAAANVNDLSDFALSQLPANTSYVAGLVSFTAASKSDAGVCEVTPQIKSGATVAPLTPIVPGVANGVYPRISELNPDNGLFWTRDQVNAIRLGYKRTA